MHTPPEFADQRNGELLTEFLDWQREVRRRQPSSLYDYQRRLTRFLAHLGPVPLGSATTEQLEDWCKRTRYGRAHGTPGAPGSVAKDMAVVRSFYTYLAGRGRIDRNPATNLVPPKLANQHPRPIPIEQWTATWAALPDEPRVVLGLGFFVGLRRQEIVSLGSHHFSVLAGKLVGFPRKGGGDDITPYGEMVGVFSDVLPHLIGGDAGTFLDPLHDLVTRRRGRPRLLDWRETRQPSRYNTTKHQLPPDALDPEWVNERMEKWLGAAGLAPNAFTPHQLRHSCATYLLQAGVPVHLVSRLLNHSNIQTTMRYVKAGGDELGDWRRGLTAQRPAPVINRFG